MYMMFMCVQQLGDGGMTDQKSRFINDVVQSPENSLADPNLIQASVNSTRSM